MTSTDQQTTDAPAFNPQAWLDGAKPAARSFVLQQRPDLVADVEDLTRRLEAADALVAAGGTPDEAPDALLAQLQDVHAQWQAGALTVRVEGRSNASREAVRRALPREDRQDDDEVSLHWLADAITEPAGLTVDFLRTVRDRQQSQYRALVAIAVQASDQVPSASYAQAQAGRRRR